MPQLARIYSNSNIISFSSIHILILYYCSNLIANHIFDDYVFSHRPAAGGRTSARLGEGSAEAQGEPLGRRGPAGEGCRRKGKATNGGNLSALDLNSGVDPSFPTIMYSPRKEEWQRRHLGGSH